MSVYVGVGAISGLCSLQVTLVKLLLKSWTTKRKKKKEGHVE